MLFHSIDAWPLFQESVHCPVREQKVWILHPRHNPGHMRLSRWIHLPSVTPSSMSVPPGMNTPYPNNDSDDTNKLLEEIEVNDSFSMTRLKILQNFRLSSWWSLSLSLSGYLHLYLYQVIFMVIFTVECFSAIIAKGLWQHDEAYLKVENFLLLR